VLREATTDMRYLERVVVIRFPVRSAQQYLQRNLGNEIGIRLVEVKRGETLGVVRCVEIQHANSSHKTWITGQRVLANGSPASVYVPDHLVTIEPHLHGYAADTKILRHDDKIIIHVPVRGYLRFLPGVFQGEGPITHRKSLRTRSTALAKWGGGLPKEAVEDVEIDEDPMRRFLAMFHHVQTTVTDRIDRLSELVDPLSTDPKFLPWLASWVGFDLDESLPIHQQRELVRRAIRLYRTRGTRRGIEEMVRVLTAAPVRIRERQKPRPVVLGKCAILGGRTIVERYRKNEDGACYLIEPAKAAETSFFALTLEPRERFRTRFGERAPGVLRRIVKVVSQETPTHVSFTIQFDHRG
jgi:phage tail-like protein